MACFVLLFIFLHCFGSCVFCFGGFETRSPYVALAGLRLRNITPPCFLSLEGPGPCHNAYLNVAVLVQKGFQCQVVCIGAELCLAVGSLLW